MIKEVIVVEGKNDTKRLKSFFDCETIETNGLGLNEETIAYIKTINEKRGVVLLLDPDSPGEKIRNKLNNEIPNLKNAFLLKQDARTNKKVGVEHANKEVILEALNHLITYKDYEKRINMNDLFELGLIGNENSKDKRLSLIKKLHIGKCNGKTLLKRLNLLNLNKKEIEELLNE